MNNNYNSILKEKKVYNDDLTNKHSMLHRAIIFGVLLSLIVIIVSYVIYYKTILDSESIFFNNVAKLYEKYSILYKNIGFNYDLSGDYEFDGNININDDLYNYSFVKSDSKLMRIFSSNNNSIVYYNDNDFRYVKMDRLGDSYVKKSGSLYAIDDYKNFVLKIQEDFYSYVYNFLLGNSVLELNNTLYNIDNYYYLINNFKNNFEKKIGKARYKRKVYLDNGRPIVDVDLVLNTDDLNDILGNGINNLEVKDNYNISISMKNDAIMNEIEYIKVIINNKTTDNRSVINYQNGNIVYTDNEGNANKIVLAIKDKYTYLKYYKNDVLYSVLSINKDNNKEIYSYQVIDKVYNINLAIENNTDRYSYILKSNIDNNTNVIKVTGIYTNRAINSLDVDSSMEYDSLNNEQKVMFDKSIKEILFG